MMLPDAPYIRQAELYGVPEPEEWECPVCGADKADNIYLDENGTILGCSCCVQEKDLGEYLAEQAEEAYEREVDRRIDYELERRWAEHDDCGSADE